ncbi:Rho GTPase-activating protein 18 [Melipona quadrifasciata]|uniref:Rho GTPase-activating protein 18 n=1 Tax=Melipona quadrifasciata TaxID=166423 RepID=A0A0M8ZNF5_9HYME|nr:Rho GTPase-activating protein 18 [Melipona quadrifasciata]
MERAQTTTYTEGDNHLLDYWEEYQKMMEETKLLDDYLEEECPRNCDDGEEEAEWLRTAGLGQLTEAWKAGREASSTGTRSRSATPDSLDSVTGGTPENASPPPLATVTADDAHRTNTVTVPNFVSVFHQLPNECKCKETVRRTPSAPSATISDAPVPAFPFGNVSSSGRGGYSLRGDVANDSACSFAEGIQLTSYHRLGTIHVSKPSIQRRSGSDPSEVANATSLGETVDRQLNSPAEHSTLRRNSGSHAVSVTRSHSSLYGLTRPGTDERLITRPLNRTSSHGHLSFEEMCRTNEETKSDVWKSEALATADDVQGRLGIETLTQRDLTRLQPLLWLELTAVFDKYNLPLKKRKPNKRRAKAGNLFGVSLSTLLLRDSQLSSEESNIPLVFQKVLNELTRRGVREEGILRVGGHKQKVESICRQLETDFYCKPKEVDKLFKCMSCHDLSAILKKLLRDLPQPLLTVELIDAFYQSHGVKDHQELSYALNLLVLLLPIENRCTLKALVKFFKLVVENQASNKMSIHNVAMIVAPSLFPPRYVHPRDRADLTAQLNMAAVCCQATEALLVNANRLWYVPNELLNQLRRHSEEERYRKYKKKFY